MKLNTDKIKILQVDTGETQEQFAKRAGLSRQGYSGILAKGSCHPRSLKKIANALNVAPEELIKD